jgi:outer membrane protein TolC
MVHAHHTASDPARKKQALPLAAHLPKFSQQASLSLAMSLALAGCVVGPDFKSPAAPQLSDNHYTATTLPAVTVETKNAGHAGIAQHPLYGQALPAQWWTLFHSAPLDQLIRSALEQNPSLNAAEAASSARKLQCGIRLSQIS